MAQTKVVLDVVEAKVEGSQPILNAYCLILFGKQKRKTAKVKKKTNHPIWNETFEFAVDLEHAPELTIGLLEIKKKALGVVKIELSNVGLTNKVQELQLEFRSTTGFQGNIRLRLSLATGAPAKVIKKKNLAKAQSQRKKPQGDALFFIKKKDVVGLEDYLLSATTEEVNSRVGKSGNTLLHEALLEKAEECVSILLGFDGIEVDIPNSSLNTPLHYFCEKWQSPAYLECFNLFIKKGANVNAVNSNGETPIFKSIFNEVIRALLMESLIESGADVNVVNDRGESVLHYAVHLGRSDLVNLILLARPKLDLKSATGHTPLELARDVYKHSKIATHLNQCEELFKWMDDNELSEYKSVFIKNEISFDLLPDLTDESLQQMSIESWGARRKILNAAAKIASLESLTAEDIKRLRARDDVVAEAAIEDLEKELQDIRQGQDEFVIPYKQLEFLQHLGAGTSGDVYKGLYKKKFVAIKMLKETSAAEEVDEFKKEFEIMSAVRNQNVVFFYGVTTQPRLCLVMEYCSRGSLYHAMKDARFDFGWQRALAIAQEVNDGLEALHVHNVFHRDLKTLNLLVTQEWHIKVCDFGLSRKNTSDNMDTMKQMRGTFAYVDPEVYNGGTFSASSDIYSMGIIFWEIANRVVTGKYMQPYSEFKHIQFDFQIVVQAAKSDLRPTIPEKCPPPFRDLIQMLLHKDQGARPNAQTIRQVLEVCQSSYQTDPAKWDFTTGTSK